MDLNFGELIFFINWPGLWGTLIFLDLIALELGKLEKKIRTIDLDFGKILFFKAIDQDLG